MRAISATPPCWEYRAIYLDRLGAVEAFDELGDQGWELVGHRGLRQLQAADGRPLSPTAPSLTGRE